MAEYFIDSLLGTGANDGLKMTDAWQSIVTGLAAAHVNSNLWIRRTSSLPALSADLVSAGANMTFSSWPRAELTFTATFTSGSTTVSPTGGSITPDLLKHVNRRIKNDADGEWYFIFGILAGNFIINKPFINSTPGTTACTIERDPLYNYAQAISAAVADDIAGWNADSDDVTIFSMGATYQMVTDLTTTTGQTFTGIKFLDGPASGSIFYDTALNTYFNLCLFEQTTIANAGVSFFKGVFSMDQCFWRGVGFNLNHDPFAPCSGAKYYISNSTFGGWGLVAFLAAAAYFWDNVNIGVEAKNFLVNLLIGAIDHYAKDLKTTLTNFGLDISTEADSLSSLFSSNHNKVHGEYLTQNFLLTSVNLPVDGSSSPNKRTGGADEIVKITFQVSANLGFDKTRHYDGFKENKIWADTSSKSYRFYINTNLALNDARYWYIECEYITDYVSDTKYKTTKVYSNETVSIATGVTDWSQYMEVTGIQPVVAGWVFLRFKIGNATQNRVINVDNVVIS